MDKTKLVEGEWYLIEMRGMWDLRMYLRTADEWYEDLDGEPVLVSRAIPLAQAVAAPQLVEALMAAQVLLANSPFMYDPQMIDSGVHRMMHKISEALEAAKGAPHE